MKFLIKESKRDELVLNWLNKNYSNLIKSGESNYLWFHNLNADYVFEYSYRTNSLKIMDKNLREMLSQIFNLDLNSLHDILIPWFKRTYNVKDINIVRYT